jgi:hypothetical protein
VKLFKVLTPDVEPGLIRAVPAVDVEDGHADAIDGQRADAGFAEGAGAVVENDVGEAGVEAVGVEGSAGDGQVARGGDGSAVRMVTLWVRWRSWRRCWRQRRLAHRRKDTKLPRLSVQFASRFVAAVRVVELVVWCRRGCLCRRQRRTVDLRVGEGP